MSQRYDYTLADAGRIGAAIGAALLPGDVVLLSGELGAGKTTLARAMLKSRGLASEAPSPTFAIVQPYAPPEVDLPIAHVDLYRIDDEGELIELGLDDYLYDGALLIEWPERLGSQGWPDALSITISGSGDARALTAEVPTSWGSRWPLR
ncbi:MULTISPECIES: tRNA (adenosine(37)-N6)-threonylcarbamoyltransferase complex ATPase subunit type 1 TsaE [unclassified Sphingopyxis]|jgi:tRNA threonylcarbamoyladenosine biosynthesis protein TsaE|uniref:tRNA (adenosine(37)-N6)-threonylcarbamoyltransferase complex ATPase subunit type 1 TsaE n=1 Tax=unclassified Sphingopyxis TaxID=2614943 RepID=UPI002860B756|nr:MULTISPECIES: tRNA (adenosine(37)-N6)-threonylcarbamoyltransferase complex ATPase subunit type 1 TsaE [unclassified Sphingopyxis]MDR6832913.1 tRNA threonylcarbamoyladenosine biosynthesis protein TsaE [Sphingopyxis sp. BE122]MDR7228656.1 tRNA threonylcarbamoyladenosine biosynthesis protein TsaE [Sphingopyxis sp. BE259]